MAETTMVNQVNVNSTPTTPPAGDPKFTPPPTFLTPSEIEDLAVRLAMSGIPFAEGLSTFDVARKTKLDALEEECRSRKAILSKRIGELNEKIANYKEQLRDFRANQADLRNA